jgi:CheY-like chemotaxis protein
MEEKPIHILVVEDEPFQRLVIMDILSMLDYEVTVVNDGHEAWAILNEKGDLFDLVLLDLVLPGMDGLELPSKINQLSWSQPTTKWTRFMRAST